VDSQGRLVLTSRKTVLLKLLRAMALTPGGTWSHDPEFGILQHFEGPRQSGRQSAPSLNPKDIAALNRSLQRLGISEYRVTAFDGISDPENGEMSFSVTIATAGRGAEVVDLPV